MKKSIITAAIIAFSFLAALAEQKPVQLDTNNKKYPNKNTGVNRAPACIPDIEVTYDSDARSISTSCSSAIEAEVMLYDAAGNLEAYSPSICATIPVLTEGIHTIRIEAPTWYAEGIVDTNPQ